MKLSLFKWVSFRYPIIPKFHHSIIPFCTALQYLVRYPYVKEEVINLFVTKQ
jgi:hypothetical protein